jgi:proline dehydrogenase
LLLQSNRQPAVEIIAQILSEKYNVTDPVVFNTYQTYLKRTPEVLKRDMKRAKTGNYIFAAKIVRGAYISSEREAANIKQQNSIGIHEDPVLPLRIDTDLAYNLAVESILESISPLNSDSSVTSNSSRPAVMIATHNRESVQLAVDIMLKLSIPNDHPNVQFAQIQGMSDHITLALSLSGKICYDLFP